MKNTDLVLSKNYKSDFNEKYRSSFVRKRIQN